MKTTPQTGDQTREVTPLSLRALFQPASVNAEARTVDLTWTTGAAVLRRDWDGQFYEELSLDPKHVRLGRLNNGAPFLPDHSGYRVADVLGVIVPGSAVLAGNEGRATVRFPPAGVSPEADKVFRLIQEGIIQNVSVGYRVHKFEKQEGGDAKIPTYRATDWEPYEISAVAMGADDGAGFRSLDRATAAHNEGSTMLEEKKETPQTPAVDVDAVRAEAQKAEQTRIAGIQAAVRTAKLGDEFAQTLIKENLKLEAAGLRILQAMAERTEKTEVDNKTIDFRITEDSRDKFVKGVSAALFERSGNGLVDAAKRKGVAGFDKVETDPGQYRGMGPLAACKEILERNGVSTRHIYNPRELVKRAASTSDFPVLFENVMHKNMRAAYATQDLTWRRVCATDTVPDFRDSNRFLNGSFSTVPVVAEGGEYQSMEIPDGEKVSISTEKRGAIISLNWEAIVNDDMGALLDVAVRFGQGTARTIETAFYALLAGPSNNGLGPTMSDGQPFFHSNRANVSTSAAITAAALDADKLKMREQMDAQDNDFLDLVPRILLVHPGLESTAKVLNTDAYDPAQVGQKSNIARGMFSDIVSSPRLTATGAATRRYLFTENKEAFKVVFLDGFGEGFQMESNEEFRRDATSWKVKIVFKVNPYEPRAAITNAGT